MATQDQLNQALSSVPSELRNHIAKLALNSQKSVLAFPYYSTCRFNAALSGAGPFAYTVAAGTRKCFNFKIGDLPGALAGFPTTLQMTKAETNLLKASETRDNADVYIWGIAVEARPSSDPYFVKQVWNNAYVELALSGTDQYLLGPLSFFPAGGGLYGAAPSAVTLPPATASTDVPLGHLNSGNPTAGNYFRLPQPVIWQANGSGKKDTSLVVSVTMDQPVAFGGVADRAASAGGASTSGTNAFVHPADGTVFCDLRIRLISVSISERSTNS